MKLRKVYNLELISLTVAFCFMLNSNIYATASSINLHLRPPLQIEKKRIFETQRIFLRDKLKRIPANVAIIGASTIILISSIIVTVKQHSFLEHRFSSLEHKLDEVGYAIDAVEYVIDKLTNLKYQLISPYADVSGIEPGDINLLLSAHSSSGDFIELTPLLDKIFEKAKSDNKKIIWYTESSCPLTKEGIEDFFPGLNIKKVFEDIKYEEQFWEKIKKIHEEYLTYYERILKEDIEVFLDEDFKMDSQIGFLLFMQRYMQGKSFDDYDLSVIPEQASLNTYKVALEIALNKGGSQKRAAFRKMRDNDLNSLIFSNYNKDAYIIVTRGILLVDLVDLLMNQGLGVNTYISAKALEYIKEALNLDSLRPFLSKSVRMSI